MVLKTFKSKQCIIPRNKVISEKTPRAVKFFGL